MPHKEYYRNLQDMAQRGIISEAGEKIRQKWEDSRLGDRFLIKLSLGSQDVFGLLRPSRKYLGGGEIFIPFGPLNSGTLKKLYKKSNTILVLQKALLKNEDALSFNPKSHLNQRPLKLKRIFFLEKQDDYKIEIDNGIFLTLDLSREENDKDRAEECGDIRDDIRARGISLHMEETFGIKIEPALVSDFL